MRTWTMFAAVFLMACSGKDTGSDTANGDDDDDDDVPPINGGGDDDDDLRCDEIPEFDTDNMDCEELWVALIDTVNAALVCNIADDCQALKVPCEDWDQANCYQIVNTCLNVRDFDAFHPEANGEFCDAPQTGRDPECECQGPPQVDCVGGYCDEKFTPP